MEKKIEELVRHLREFTTPELCDGAGLYHSMDYQIKQRIGRKKIVGPAVTVDVPSGEGAIVADAILKLEPGSVLVVAGKGNCDCSYWGDHRSICADMMGAEGVVIDGAFRDLEDCERAGFPIYAKGLTCGTAAKSGAGAINVPVSCGGVCVNPGDLIIGDVNGVCVLRPDEAEAVMERAMKKRILQEKVIQEMRQTGVVNPKVKLRNPED
ncbi:RraA family protein [Brotaphodocola sp.]|uniref:RraA family protein n=1 Tax=Brotaphodocola sp. TaxID=3073577 RepID=UPI003D7CDA95